MIHAVRQQIAAVLLAGGASRSMGGGNKCLRLLAGRPLLAHVIDCVRPQVGPLARAASTNRRRAAA